MEYLIPVEAVLCPKIDRLTPVGACKECSCCEEIRQPWRYWIVKCKYKEVSK